MILHYARLSDAPVVFVSLTGLRVVAFDALVTDLLLENVHAGRLVVV